MRVAHLALVAVGDFIKNVIAVDADIDPFDIHDVLFSVGTRVDANTYQVEKVLGLDANRHDPSAMGEYLRVGGLIIDITKPLDVPFPELGVPDKKLLDGINLYDHVPREKVRQLLSGCFQMSILPGFKILGKADRMIFFVSKEVGVCGSCRCLTVSHVDGGRFSIKRIQFH
jgi:3-polyprenyl-4-hydroxybenzoate decarboxylase